MSHAPHTPRAALIVSHGQPSDPDPAEAALAALARRVAAELPGWQVGSATLAKTGALDAACEAARPTPLVYPLFMTQGWFTGENLRQRLSGTYGIRVLPPLGVEAGLPGLAVDLLHDVLAAQGWKPQETALFIAGHGSGRSPNSARDTQSFAAALTGRTGMREVRLGYVEQAPFLADVARGLGAKAICLPFFAAKGGHVIDDIPQALDTAGFQGVRLGPIGCAPRVPALIAASLRAAAGKAFW